jgi:general secretion pathway protein C
MELFFRKYFWTVHLLFIVLVAFLIARTANLFVESVIAPLPKANGGGLRQVVHTVVEGPALLTIEKLAKATGLPVPLPEPEIKEPSQAVDLDAAPVKSGLRVKLLGTLMAGKPEWSIASIQDVVTLKSGTYMVEDEIQGAKVLEIERAKVIILRNGRREYIDGEAGSGEAAPPPPSLRPASAVNDGAPPPVAMGTGIKALNENEYEVPRAEIDKTLSNLNDVAMQARIVPAFKDGVATGFKLFSIRPDSIYTKIGVQNGDVIRRINGYDLNSPEKALEVYAKLKEANRIDIEIERNGAIQKKTYNIGR